MSDGRRGASGVPAERPGGGPEADLGPNAWLVDDMYTRYEKDPTSVPPSWRRLFDARTAPAQGPQPDGPGRRALRSGEPRDRGDQPAGVDEEVVTLRGAASTAASNMEASLGVPTATSVRAVPARLLEVNRQILNNQLGRTTGGKVSFTHLIGYAVVRALADVPALNASYVADADGRGTPGVVRHRQVGLGIAVDVERAGGRRSLLVPCIKDAGAKDFAAFVAAYEELVEKVHHNRLSPDDFAGTTVTLTNPGTLGTVQSVPRLMPGQGAIIGVGALAYPPGFEAADEHVLAEMGIGKVLNLTSTYDHRIIQGAESGLFLAQVSRYLMGEGGFYDDVFAAMEVPYEPARWRTDVHGDGTPGTDAAARLVKQVHVQTLINIYRVRGHLIANLDPLEMEAPELHPELDPLTYGLTIWDLPRTFMADGLAGRERATLDEILHTLREAYCRTLGIEYMHIQDPEQKRWIQHHVEGVSTSLAREDQLHVLDRLNAAEAFERFLHSRYIGQKRFGLEGAESTIVILDAVLDEAARSGTAEVVMGMAHRGRLNVLANIVGKSYREIFSEFEGNLDPESVQGSGDVKYHKGASGKFTGPSGVELPVTLASNPSHLEAVDPVVLGMARARQDQLVPPGDGTAPAPVSPSERFPVLSVLIHGDAAFSGQGVVAETLNLSGLSGYRTGGTVHLVINNQLGFTTAPQAARTSVYATDVAKMVQAPIFHVNGDDPEACFRAARLAVGFRQRFHKDVVIDLICYRLHGHNEGDDPSYTQPLMYKKIEAHPSVRRLYTERLVRRGDITAEEADGAVAAFNARLQAALDEVRAAPPAPPAEPARPETGPAEVAAPATGVDEAALRALAAAVRRLPEGFTLHPKLARQFAQRDAMFDEGIVDWSSAEALAFGSILLDGDDVRVTGQDTRRGTFSQRHAVLVDFETGREFVPLAHVGARYPDGEPMVEEAGREGRRGRFTIRDSLLSEYAALGFEYGYSVEAPESLVAWEAQFGDFDNGAQVVIDNFVVAAEDKWGQRSGLVLLLPHGYEGQGPEHSSARIERFLTLCARGNMRVAQPTTAAQYFHLLRAQVRWSRPTPLVVFTPKSLLRSPPARSPLAELAAGRFLTVLDDPDVADSKAVRRVLLCTGKVGHEVMARRQAGAPSGGPPVAVVRLEQLYPWPRSSLEATLARYGAAEEVVWLQEEPENMGAWTFVHGRLHRLLRERYVLRHLSRPESPSPATGSLARHQQEQAALLDAALS